MVNFLPLKKTRALSFRKELYSIICSKYNNIFFIFQIYSTLF